MSFREKMHWVSLIAILGGFGWYFGTLHLVGYGHSPGDTGEKYYFGLLIATIVGILTVMIIGAALIAIFKPKDAKYAWDERDRLIHMRGTHAAYYILVVGMWATGLSLHFGYSLFFMLNAMLAIIVVAESIRIGTQLYLYRRGT